MEYVLYLMILLGHFTAGHALRIEAIIHTLRRKTLLVLIVVFFFNHNDLLIDSAALELQITWITCSFLQSYVFCIKTIRAFVSTTFIFIEETVLTAQF